MIVVDPERVEPKPWRNGRGITRELWAEPPGADFEWRLSLADLGEDGPFSRFDAVERVFTPVVGGGFELVVDGRPHHADRYQQIRFPGEAEVALRGLVEPARVLNLMTARGRCRGEVHVRRCHGEVTWPAGVRSVLLAAGRLEIGDVELPRLGLAVAEGAALSGVAGEALIAEVHISRDAQGTGG
ncbi:HutD family protein [Saccharopolyspora sp. WRP15-2]|uniref:HutD family protein n=1 Tax=Saccharopolyspora oryzae TaxID=2997343 RepID=A0ABT4UQP1_9PSEU|nr:HutD family protein [Saccharopolyspora oryzae]MDA3624028.1 HutD family protein [Saccharopolyspora oryzae]